jgi:hypothetical protein
MVMEGVPTTIEVTAVDSAFKMAGIKNASNPAAIAAH